MPPGCLNKRGCCWVRFSAAATCCIGETFGFFFFCGFGGILSSFFTVFRTEAKSCFGNVFAFDGGLGFDFGRGLGLFTVFLGFGFGGFATFGLGFGTIFGFGLGAGTASGSGFDAT